MRTIAVALVLLVVLIVPAPFGSASTVPYGSTNAVVLVRT